MTSRMFRPLTLIIALALVGLTIAACQSSDDNAEVMSAVNEANQAAREAAATDADAQ